MILRSRQNSNDLLTVVFSSQSISIGYITFSHDCATLVAYDTVLFSSYDIYDGIIYNMAACEKALRAHMTAQELSSIPVAIALIPDCIKQEFIWMHTPSPQTADISLPDRDRYIWQNHYLYPDDEGGFYHYISALYPWLLYQYQRLAQQCDLNLVRLESHFSASLTAYRMLHGNAFRMAQLRSDMEQNNNNIMTFFTPDKIQRLLRISSSKARNDKEQDAIVGMIGLYYAHKELV